MKKIIQYKSNDGSVWNTASHARHRDRLIASVAKAMAPLGDVPEAVQSGKGWLQHDLETVLKAKDDILCICRDLKLNKQWDIFDHPGRSIHTLSSIGHILNDMGGPLDTAWNRFCRIDPSGREHQQCYYAYTAGPDLSHICIEDRRKSKPSKK